MTSYKEIAISLRGKRVTLDTNILILLVIGYIGKEHILKFKRTSIFTTDDFDLLVNLIKHSMIVLTPNILTETSNLLEEYKYNGKNIGLKGIEMILKKFMKYEIYTTSEKLSSLSTFLKFGLTDSSIFELCNKDIIAITVDLPLYGFLFTMNKKVINFNHLKVI